MMMVPRRSNFGLLDDMFGEPFFRHPEHLEDKIMRTDIKENDDSYLLIVDLPGYDKENIKVDVEDGYLTIHASKNVEEEDKDSSFVRKERYFGECSRSFYVGEDINSEDVKASYRNGTLNLEVPKKDVKKELPEKKYVQIDD